MFTKIVDRSQLDIGFLIRDIATKREVFEIESYDAEADYYELSVYDKVTPQTGGKGDSVGFGATFEVLSTNYEVNVVEGGFRDEGEAW